MSCAVSLVPKFAKYMKLVLELVLTCKYGASICIRTYVQPAWRASVAVAESWKALGGPSVRIFLQDPLIFYLVMHVNLMN